MAEVSFTAFVEDTVRGQSGGVFVLKTAEPHRKQVDGQWVTESRTFRDVKVSRDSGISLDGFTKGDRVLIVGQEKTEVRAGVDKKHYTLVTWASAISRVESRGQTVQQPANEPDAFAGSQWDTATPGDDSSIPF